TVTISTPENISNDHLSVDVLDLTFNQINLSKQINASYEFGFNLYDYEYGKDLSYSSQDENIATVTEYGVVTAKSVGKTYIDITGGNLARRVEINVLQSEEIAAMDTQAGNKHTVGLKTNGTLWAFGNNSYGQLGIGEITNANYADPAEVTTVPEGVKFTKIAVGKNHTLALDINGYVYSFGANSNGQLGNGSNMDSGNVSKIEGLENIVKIAAYENMSMAINKDGELYVWGGSYTSVPTKIDFYSKVIDVSGQLILSEYGTVWNLSNLAQKVSNLTNIVEITSGDSHNMALASDGTVYVWGNNSYGQLGTGDTVSSNIPVVVKDLPLAESIKAGQYNSYVLTRAGEVYSFGRNSNSSLGLGIDDSYITTATKVDSENVERISAGQNYAVYVKDDGFVYSWGVNTAGQLGQSDKQTKSVPTLIGSVKIANGENCVTLKESETHTINVTLNNTFNLRQDIIDSTGFTYKSINSNIASVNSNVITGENSGFTTVVVKHETSGKIANIYVEVLRDSSESVIDVKSGTDFSIALKADGTVWSWGLNNYGQLGLGDNTNYNEPKQITLDSRAKQIMAGNSHIVILT
ncbi:MAG: hypothetical protein IJ272_05960, partial [Clostridia bacterium]|nr:hypothetical protein [Clostridia bacterium]